MPEHSTYVTSLQCSYCHEVYDHTEVQTTCRKCGRVLFVQYDSSALGRCLDRKTFDSRQNGLWAWREFLPIADPQNMVSLGEGGTPLLKLLHFAEELGLGHLLLKDEGLNPTGTFKARGLSVAVSCALELGISGGVIPSAGNAASAFCAYAARGGMQNVHVFVPADAPEITVTECESYGASVHKVNGLINDAGREAREFAAENGLLDFSTLKEPYRLEGKKTMGLELVQQLHWQVPDVIIYPTGGGTGFIGIWKAMEELASIGWISGKRPRMICVQSNGCAPIVRAFERGQEYAELWKGANTIAGGIRVPGAIGDYLMLRIIKESGGDAITVSDHDIIRVMKRLAKREGVFVCPEGAAALAGLEALAKDNRISPEDTVVVINTGSGLKQPELYRSN